MVLEPADGHLCIQIIEQIRHKASIVHSLPPSIKAEAVNAYVIALRWVYIYNGIVAVIGFLVCLPVRFLPRWLALYGQYLSSPSCPYVPYDTT